eukprot:2388229-Alexandrium_andersonii.AAC.1
MHEHGISWISLLCDFELTTGVPVVGKARGPLERRQAISEAVRLFSDAVRSSVRDGLGEESRRLFAPRKGQAADLRALAFVGTHSGIVGRPCMDAARANALGGAILKCR